MATMGPSTTRAVEAFPGTMLKLARQEKGLTQRQIAPVANVLHTTIGQDGNLQASWPVLCRILAAVDLEMRVRLETYDDHDDVLDRYHVDYVVLGGLRPSSTALAARPPTSTRPRPPPRTT
jgi:hypothetical protein